MKGVGRMDGRTYHALEKRTQNLLDGEDVKIGKNTYHINSTEHTTDQGGRIYSIQQNDKHCAYLYYKKYDPICRQNDGWVISSC